jgi:hypothetical protein
MDKSLYLALHAPVPATPIYQYNSKIRSFDTSTGRPSLAINVSKYKKRKPNLIFLAKQTIETPMFDVNSLYDPNAPHLGRKANRGLNLK